MIHLFRSFGAYSTLISPLNFWREATASPFFNFSNEICLFMPLGEPHSGGNCSRRRFPVWLVFRSDGGQYTWTAGIRCWRLCSPSWHLFGCFYGQFKTTVRCLSACDCIFFSAINVWTLFAHTVEFGAISGVVSKYIMKCQICVYLNWT